MASVGTDVGSPGMGVARGDAAGAGSVGQRLGATGASSAVQAVARQARVRARRMAARSCIRTLWWGLGGGGKDGLPRKGLEWLDIDFTHKGVTQCGT